MSRPSKLKRAIKEMEIEIEGFEAEIESLKRIMADRLSTIEMLKKIDNEKSSRKEGE